MGSFTNKITAEFTPPKTWKLEEDLGFREGSLTKQRSIRISCSGHLSAVS